MDSILQIVLNALLHFNTANVRMKMLTSSMLSN